MASPSLSPLLDASPRKYNTHRLFSRLGVDVLAAASAGVLVAPIITMIDKGIIENASGKRALKESLKSSVREAVMSPGRFFLGRPFGLIFVSGISAFPGHTCLDWGGGGGTSTDGQGDRCSDFANF